MDSRQDAWRQLKELLQGQALAVLATSHEGHPYCSLVAFVVSDDMRTILFGTSRNTRKFANLTSDPRVSVLIDNRGNTDADFHEACAATAVGREVKLPEVEYIALRKKYLARHPHLRDFVSSPTFELVALRIETYYLVTRFQHVMELRLEP
ncbi:MAG: pyridoxamine 5'-phosphate oxidase family protein [Armatimonadetes bacterium]|nr:pyridoxamine 5'-phosphate oxidase family protein [Armatimonadota bacterium]